MKKWAILLTVFCSLASLDANDAVDRQLGEDPLSKSHESEKMASRPSNHDIYQAAVQDWASRRVCPREHPGVFFDTTYETPGIWCCRGIMHDGQKCFFHIDRQYPKGVPKG